MGEPVEPQDATTPDGTQSAQAEAPQTAARASSTDIKSSKTAKSYKTSVVQVGLAPNAKIGSEIDQKVPPADKTLARRLRRGLRIAAAAAAMALGLVALYAGVVWVRLPSIDGLGAGDPGPTAFMRQDACEAPRRQYRPLASIDPRLGCAVVWAEDAGFFRHGGVDWAALRRAAVANWDAGRIRLGGSTLAMQLARNLFLSRARTPSRKFGEIALARRLIGRYGHQRALELYLNGVEWAPCVYGAQAAAQHYFGHGAQVVDAAEAVFLASMLPRPRRPPGSGRDRSELVARQQALLTHLGRAGVLAPATVRAARAEVLALWREIGSHRPAADEPAEPSIYQRGCGAPGGVSGPPGFGPKPAQF